MKVKVEITDDGLTIAVVDNLNCMEDYLQLRGEVKFAVESYVNKHLKKPNITLIFAKTVSYINSISLGFLLWLQGDYAEEFTVRVYNEDLYEVLDVIGLTNIWNVEKRQQ